MLAQTQHAVESNARMVASAFVDGDAVNDVALAEIFKRPEQMLRGDAKHRGADAHAWIERDDSVVLQFLAETVDGGDFRADGPLRPRRRSFYGFDNAFCRADLIGGLCNVEAAFRVNDYANAGAVGADALDFTQSNALGTG